MQVRLTQDGQKALGISGRKIVMVSDDRAFALMSRGFAAQDKGFMSLFDGPLPKKEKAEVKTAPKPEKKIEKPKKEQAVSKKAKKRETAVKK